MMEYNVTATGTLDNTRPFNFRKQVTADNIAALKEWFKQQMAVICFKNKAETFQGTVTVQQRQWSTVATDKPFTGTFSVTETIVIEF